MKSHLDPRIEAAVGTTQKNVCVQNTCDNPMGAGGIQNVGGTILNGGVWVIPSETMNRVDFFACILVPGGLIIYLAKNQ